MTALLKGSLQTRRQREKTSGQARYSQELARINSFLICCSVGRRSVSEPCETAGARVFNEFAQECWPRRNAGRLLCGSMDAISPRQPRSGSLSDRPKGRTLPFCISPAKTPSTVHLQRHKSSFAPARSTDENFAATRDIGCPCGMTGYAPIAIAAKQSSRAPQATRAGPR